MPRSIAEKEARLRRLIEKQVSTADEPTKGELLRRALLVPAEVYELGLQRDLPILVREFSVCSLSAIADSVLMWSHYADCHRGLCLRFHPLTRDSQARHIPEKAYFEFAYPVTYSAERPTISIPVANQEETLERTILTKADFWKYEEEWRLIAHTGGAGPRPFPPECLDAVILGARMPELDREEIKGWIAQRSDPITLLEAKFDHRLFRLNIE